MAVPTEFLLPPKKAGDRENVTVARFLISVEYTGLEPATF